MASQPRTAIDLAPASSTHPVFALALALLAVPGTTWAWELPLGGLWLGLPLAVVAIVLGLRARRQGSSRTVATVAVTLAGLCIAQMVVWSVASAEATFPGVNGRISFFAIADSGKSGEIFTARPDGSDVQRLTRSGPGRYSQISDWSADGERIAFDRGRAHTSQIYVMNANGSGITRLTRGPARHANPSWSPDAAMIAMDTRGSPDLQGIWVIPSSDPDGVTQDEATRVTTPPQSVDFDAEPQFSPDGTRIAFTRFKHYPHTSAIYVVDVGGTGLERLTPWGLNASDADWSPDGEMITFDSGDSLRVGTKSDIYVMRGDGSGRKRLTDDRRRREGDPINATANPVWSPDGRTIMYSRYLPERSVLKAMRADGTRKRVVVARAGFPNRVDWGAGP